jgi:phospholipid/cholesterol/gamma-HCH transport system permease protein
MVKEMETDLEPQPDRYEILEKDEGNITLHIRGSINASNAASLVKDTGSVLQERSGSSLTVDLEEATYLDDYGVLALAELREMMTNRKGLFYLVNPGKKVKEILSLFDFESLTVNIPFEKKIAPNVFVRMGEAFLHIISDAKHMISFVGAVFLSLLYICIHPRSLRADDTFLCMRRTGVDALPIVGLISFLLGMIIAFMSSIQLRQFGANIYVASLVGLAMTYEISPLGTAIVVAGRSGSSFASEIGTMKISEEVDALYTMGFDPTRFLVVPKILAAVLTVPILTLFSDVFAILGGLVVGVFVLDLTSTAYINQTISTVTMFYFFWGVMKSGVFALIIAWVGCLRGFQVRGGADSVGKATTSAVVSGIFLIVVMDSIFAIIHVYWL